MASRKKHCCGIFTDDIQEFHTKETYSQVESHSRWASTAMTVSEWRAQKHVSEWRTQKQSKFLTTPPRIQHASEMSMSQSNAGVKLSSPKLRSQRKKDKSKIGNVHLSPVLGSQRNIDESRGETVRKANPSQKKVKVNESQVPKNVLSPPNRLTSNGVPDSPSSMFMSHDDSLLENIDFDEIDSICSSVASTPKRKLMGVGTSRASSLEISENSHRHSLCKTPQRTKSLGDFSVNSPVTKRKESDCDKSENCESKENQIFDRYLKFPPRKLIQNRNITGKLNKKFCVSENSYSHSSSSVTQNIPSSDSRYGNRLEEKSVLSKSQHFHGRDSPDIFNEEPLGSSNEKLSESFDAELCLIEEGYFKKCVADFGKAEITTKQNYNMSRVSPSYSASPSESAINSPDSQLSFTSTLDSQSLIGRFQHKLKEIATSQLSAPLKSDSERRAEAVAAALEEATKTHQSGEDFQLGPFFGLPSRVAEIFKVHRGIAELYSWQEDCINEGIQSRNLLISLPTSGGKTLVAEILMLRQILLKKRDVVFILPYVSLVQEKVRGLAPFGVELEFLVEEYAGSRGTFPPKPRRKKHVIYVATIEKASGLLNALLETCRMKEVGLVVVDEVHMLAEIGGRGAVLEGILTKMRYAASKVQLVAMSATVGNMKELAIFMDAKVFAGKFRPVQLTEYVKYSQEQKRMDADMVAGLVGEVIPDHSCLVFCPTRRNCETLAELLCRVLPRGLLKVRDSDKVSLYRAIVEECGGSVCPVLKKTLPYGIAYHHSGISLVFANKLAACSPPPLARSCNTLQATASHNYCVAVCNSGVECFEN
ncbi:uncharacterized protein [Panulirus ornatus]|uniref:uncharacterized protein isoform X2 n=1 Tax=Panulirus ornatus TaxID=150431 RepID=UPI003A898D25